MCFSSHIQLETVSAQRKRAKSRVSENVIYWFLTRFYELVTPVVNADAGTEPKDSTVDEDLSDDENLSDDQQVKKKQKREKVGFRDRKVSFLSTLFPSTHITLWLTQKRVQYTIHSFWFFISVDFFSTFFFFEIFHTIFVSFPSVFATMEPIKPNLPNFNHSSADVDNWVWKSYAIIFDARQNFPLFCHRSHCHPTVNRSVHDTRWFPSSYHAKYETTRRYLPLPTFAFSTIQLH